LCESVQLSAGKYVSKKRLEPLPEAAAAGEQAEQQNAKQIRTSTAGYMIHTSWT
jgi:hypothetical protein